MSTIIAQILQKSPFTSVLQPAIYGRLYYCIVVLSTINKRHTTAILWLPKLIRGDEEEGSTDCSYIVIGNKLTIKQNTKGIDKWQTSWHLAM